MKLQIVFFITADWESYHRKEMIKTLARVGGDSVEILCINRPIDFVIAPIRHIRKFIKWLSGENRDKRIFDNLHVFTPLIILHDLISSRIIGLKQLLMWMLRFQIKKRLSDNGNVKNVTWICSPNQEHFTRLFPDNILVYDVIDEHTLTFEGKENKQTKIIEEIILNRADKIFVASENLYHSKKGKNSEVYYIPTGISKELLKFTSLPLPQEISDIYYDIPSPRIGYLGHVRNWIDFPLLQFAAKNNPDFSFVFIGTVGKHINVKRLSALKNVFFLGTVDYNLAMFHLRLMDVCIIPFLINKFMINSCPYKLFDYLAAGKPIVSTALPEVRKFSPYAQTANNKEEFDRMLKKAVKNSPDFIIPPQLIEENLWEKRVEQMFSLLRTPSTDS